MISELIYALLVIMLVFLSGMIVGGGIITDTFEEKAVSLDCAQYNPRTAKFEWKE